MEFWFLFGAMAFFHETAHGLTCKHFGARVEKMQFLLMYFAPTFMCDCTQVWIVGDKKARISTIIAGIWGDLMICVVATFIWWGTATGMWIHDFAYKVMMVTGIGVTLLNLNPLIKLDGYYLLSELIDETDLKEESTVYVSSWTRKHIFRLPAEVEYVPRHRRVLYIVYSAAFECIQLSAHGLGGDLRLPHPPEHTRPSGPGCPRFCSASGIFKSRIIMLERFMKTVYLDKKERVLAWFTPVRAVVLGVVALALLFAPLWPEFVDGRFALEPLRRTLVHTEVPGTVTEVLGDEGQPVAAGGPLLRLRNLELESAAAQAGADLRNASARAIQAGMSYENFGPAEHERQQSTVRQRSLARGGQTPRSHQSHRRHRHHPAAARSAGCLPEIRYRGRRGGRFVHHEGPHLHSRIQHAGCSPGGPGAPACRVTIQALVRDPGVGGARLLPDRDRTDRESPAGRHSGAEDSTSETWNCKTGVI